ncbi:MAG: 50S ribosomal protein L37ae [Candidatus Micrarchaeota archaeon]|nr:50S ribosomal protein L37ae [Candidatus Micrarchaeota archaeon]
MANASIRYGVSLRKRLKSVMNEKQARYKCDVCGKDSVKRVSTGIWACRSCGAKYAGGAYSMKTATGDTFNRVINQLTGGK